MGRPKKTLTIAPITAPVAVVEVEPKTESIAVAPPKKARKPRAKKEKVAEVPTIPIETLKEMAKSTSKSKTDKAKRTPSAYNLFIKAHYGDADIKAMKDSQTRFVALSKMWRDEKAKSA